jgi:hypothetical protein
MSEKGGWGPVVGAAAGLILFGLLVCFAPFIRCPACRGAGTPPSCAACGDSGRVSLKAKWDWRRSGIR